MITPEDEHAFLTLLNRMGVVLELGADNARKVGAFDRCLAEGKAPRELAEMETRALEAFGYEVRVDWPKPKREKLPSHECPECGAKLKIWVGRA